ncbi:bifunctional aldolase/short-chain dehydrogenase [Candidatus Magnetaquicoccus inordinatus]|uniref:bifunctional aldolase/short-chain dehydrogenase n=1 Tax=Candidatus Magnetaquicoccus inordinatus TaxID=2496818 RepID=UPI00102BCDE7|nr:bifunctional aldolase/short-chain dehydrogenase [Candidatus Magnetaquicoccus inordinatus]
MHNRWSADAAAQMCAVYASRFSEALALRTYASRLLGSEPALVLHGGGNTSVKGVWHNLLGEPIAALYVKASGGDLAVIEPEEHTAVALDLLCKVRQLPELSDAAMVHLLRGQRLDPESATPSIETLLHAFLPDTYIDHSHADAVLTLSNQENGAALLAEALGEDVLILPYIHPGFALAKAVAEARERAPNTQGMVLMQHGLLTWGESAEESYGRMIALVNRVEEYLGKAYAPATEVGEAEVESAWQRYRQLAPVLRGALACDSGNVDQPFARFILLPWIDQEVLSILRQEGIGTSLVSPPLTSDHLIRLKPLPLWLQGESATVEGLGEAIVEYRQAYSAYIDRQAAGTLAESARYDTTPRVVLIPEVGAICVGADIIEAKRVRDLLCHTLRVKETIFRMGGRYQGLAEADCFAMEYYAPQRAKLSSAPRAALGRQVALVTGAAGAIGSGICRELLAQGVHLAASDLPGPGLDSLRAELQKLHGERVMAVGMDVTDPEAVAQGLQQIVGQWGGLDLLVLNAGLAHVSSLEKMQVAAFQRLQRVNVEGTLHLLTAVSRLFRQQATGGDVVLISTKNVFAPGAQFAAYSATKAAAHQLARIASLELAPLGVRVNMVAPDGVFADGERPSGLWAEVGPERMRARGLDAAGLQEYYQNRNLLKARITATHVAHAVLYFATRQAPCTGVTLPVDGGLPDATPR